VNEVSERLFADPALARDEDPDIERGDPSRLVINLAHYQAAAGQAVGDQHDGFASLVVSCRKNTAKIPSGLKIPDPQDNNSGRSELPWKGSIVARQSN
jgi:hypothetical protein